MALTKIPASLLDTSSGITLGDNEKALFGAGSDLEIYHDGSNSIIADVGTGGLKLTSGDIYFRNPSDQDMIYATSGGAVTLYHNNVAKLATTSTGASVTGDLAVSGNLTVSGTTTELDTTNLNVTDKNITLNYHASSDTSSNADGAGITIQDAVDGSNDATLTWNTSLDKFDLSHGLHIGDSAAIGDATTPALQIGGTTTYRLGMYTNSEGGIIENKNGDDGLQFRVKTAGEAMRIDGGTGNVGIGTDSPAVTLDVTGNGRFDSVSGNALRLDRVTSGNNIDIDFYNPIGTAGVISRIRTDGDGLSNLFGALSFHTGTTPDSPTEAMRIDSVGRVMIAETSSSGYSANADDLIVGDNGSATERGISIGSTAGGGIRWNDGADAGVIEYSHSGNSMRFYTTATERMRIDSSGNVGIGTTAPGVALDISTSTANTNGVVRIQNNMDNNYEALRLHSLGNYDAQMSFLAQGDSTYWGAFGIDYSDAGKFKLQTDNLFVGGSTLMTWARDGKVGIGTSNPAHQLDISNSGNAVMRLHAGASSSASLRLQNDAQHWDVNLQTNDKFAVYDHTTNTQPFTILPTSGNVGIGTDSPDKKLEIMGGSYDQIRIGSNHTDNTNKLAGIVSTTYTNQSVSVFQMFNQNGSNAIYYGSADGAHRGIQTHNFYVNTNYNSTSGHTRTLQIRSDGDVHAAYTGSADTSGYFYAGKDWGAGNHRINRAVAQGNTILVISAYGSSGQDTALFYGCSGQDASTSAAGLRMQKNSSTNRSINDAGTINASGSDYAEYVKKSDTCGTIAKGDICGIDTNSKLTDKWSEAHSFVVKSTDPSYVGGDTWGALKRPELTKQGHADPDNPADESDSEYATRTTQHETDLAAFETASEAERVKYDRIAFSGQVPCNLTGASVGDYIIPKEGTSDAITGEAVSTPTFEQYQKAVGKVWKVLDNGKAWISVKIG